MQTALHQPNLLAGLIDDQVEFFSPMENQVMAIHGGKVLSFEEFPEWIIERIRQDMIENPQTLKELNISEINNASIFQYTCEMFGGIDQQPDIDTAGRVNRTEYLATGIRQSIPLEDGQKLTKSEIAVLKLAHLHDKAIAENLFISVETVTSHWQNMRTKTGLAGKVELAIWATKKGII